MSSRNASLLLCSCWAGIHRDNSTQPSAKAFPPESWDLTPISRPVYSGKSSWGGVPWLRYCSGSPYISSSGVIAKFSLRLRLLDCPETPSVCRSRARDLAMAVFFALAAVLIAGGGPRTIAVIGYNRRRAGVVRAIGPPCAMDTPSALGGSPIR